jgi:hypothetical protein
MLLLQFDKVCNWIGMSRSGVIGSQKNTLCQSCRLKREYKLLEAMSKREMIVHRFDEVQNLMRMPLLQGGDNHRNMMHKVVGFPVRCSNDEQVQNIE